MPSHREEELRRINERPWEIRCETHNAIAHTGPEWAWHLLRYGTGTVHYIYVKWRHKRQYIRVRAGFAPDVVIWEQRELQRSKEEGL